MQLFTSITNKLGFNSHLVFKDLGIMYHTSLCLLFNARLVKICISAIKILGFVIHNLKELTKLVVIRLLCFISLVCSILEQTDVLY